MASGPKAFLRVGAVVLGVLALVVQGEVTGQTASDLSVVRAVEDYRLGQLDQAKTAFERSLQGRLSETDRGVALAYLGLIEMAVGRDPARFFREAVLADPALELDPAAHAPARIQRFDGIRHELLEVATIEIVLGADSIRVGRETTVGVRVVNTEGLELRNLPVRFSARGPGELVVVGGEDRVRGLRPGEVTVEAEIFLTGPPRRVAKPIWVVEAEVRLEPTLRSVEGTSRAATSESSVDRRRGTSLFASGGSLRPTGAGSVWWGNGWVGTAGLTQVWGTSSSGRVTASFLVEGFFGRYYTKEEGPWREEATSVGALAGVALGSSEPREQGAYGILQVGVIRGTEGRWREEVGGFGIGAGYGVRLRGVSSCLEARFVGGLADWQYWMLTLAISPRIRAGASGSP